MTRTEINGEVFRNHGTKEKLDEALAILEAAGAAYPEREPTGGANRERWFLTNPAK